ncbi:MAG: transposase [Candidatus Omnitrophota bacterium]
MKEYKTRKLNRLKKYDYSLAGYYYVTLCTHGRREIFGGIENYEMKINQYGKIVERVWLQIPEHCSNVELGEFIVMPNHIHGIMIINNPVGTGHALSSNKNTKNNNLSVIIGSFKSAASKQINQLNNMSFKWQRSFYDHIIRTTHSLKNIQEYIINNSKNWDTDEYNIANCSIKDKACLVPTGQV